MIKRNNVRVYADIVLFLLIGFCIFANESKAEVIKNDRLLIPPDGKKYFGAFTTMPSGNFDETMKEFEKLAGKTVAICMTFMKWDKDGKGNYPMKFAERAYKKNAVPMITWEPQFTYDRTTGPKLSDIANGKYDKYITSFCKQAGSFHKPFFIRFAHEMEGDHYPWSERFNKAQTKQDYINAFRRVATLARQASSNAIIIWSPAGGNHNADAYYPGDEYVDWIGASLYNFSKWPQDPMFNDQLGAWLKILKKHNKPAMICEMGAAEKYRPNKSWDPNGDGNYDDHKAWIFPEMADKSKWLNRFFDVIESNEQIKGFVWFHINKEADWRINSSKKSLETFRKRISNPIYDFSPQLIEIGPESVRKME